MMYRKYIAGFVNPRENLFIPNRLTDHKGNATQIIRQKNWWDDWRADVIMRREAPDYLIFRKGFIQIGNGDDKLIIVSSDQFRKGESYIWRSISKSLTESDFNIVSQYRVIQISPPKF